MDWFEHFTGFREDDYASTRAKLSVEGDRLRSLVNGQSYGIGRLDLPSLEDLRLQARFGIRVPGSRIVRIVEGNVGPLHQRSEYAGALFQVASQFNMLEMIGPSITPEHGVTGYAHDRTQGPACAIAAGAATIYRNYFVPAAGQAGQTQDRQLNGFADLGAALARALGRPAGDIVRMRNGYAMFDRSTVDAVSAHIRSLGLEARDELRRKLRIGIHWDVEVTAADGLPRLVVSQAFCSALPVSYNDDRTTAGADWEPFAGLLLEAAYETTLWAAVVNAQRGKSHVVLLTLLGGGVFGNLEPWILAAMKRAIDAVGDQGLEIVIVSYKSPSPALWGLVRSKN